MSPWLRAKEEAAQATHKELAAAAAAAAMRKEEEEAAAAAEEAAQATRQELAAGAYTRSLFSSARAVPDTRKHPTHHKHPLTPLNTPQHPFNTGYTITMRTPCPIKSAQVELRSERV